MISKYVYCNNNPLSRVDPSGMMDMESEALTFGLTPDKSINISPDVGPFNMDFGADYYRRGNDILAGNIDYGLGYYGNSVVGGIDLLGTAGMVLAEASLDALTVWTALGRPTPTKIRNTYDAVKGQVTKTLAQLSGIKVKGQLGAGIRLSTLHALEGFRQKHNLNAVGLWGSRQTNYSANPCNNGRHFLPTSDVDPIFYGGPPSTVGALNDYNTYEQIPLVEHGGRGGYLHGITPTEMLGARDVYSMRGDQVLFLGEYHPGQHQTFMSGSVEESDYFISRLLDIGGAAIVP